MADEVPNITDGSDDAAPTATELLNLLLNAQKEQRAEVAALRQEIAEARDARRPAPASATPLTPEEQYAARMELVNQFPFYCPGCGALYKRERECTGRGEAPHPEIEVVSTDELKQDDPSKHTAAPGVKP